MKLFPQLYHQLKNNLKSRWNDARQLLQGLFFVLFFVSISIISLSPTIAIGAEIVFGPYQRIDDASLDVRFSSLLFVVDQSSSMFDWDDGMSRFEQQRKILQGITQVLPTYSHLQIALRAFGGRTASDSNVLAPGHGLQDYKPLLLYTWLDEIKPDIGDLSMRDALQASLYDIEAVEGQRVGLFLVSDGMDKADGADKVLRNLITTILTKNNAICVFILQVGNGGKHTHALKTLLPLDTSKRNCNLFVQSKILTNNAGMQTFVKQALLEQVPDSDNDGVYDHSDKCLATPHNVHVDNNGCPLDADADGVADYLDDCPETAANRSVNSKGCFVIPRSFVVLVANNTGGVGAVTFANKLGEQHINQANMAIGMTNNTTAPNKPFIMSKEYIQTTFAQTMQYLPKAPAMFSLPFAYNEDVLPKTSRSSFRLLVKEIRSRNNPDILIIGYTDAMGSVRYNNYLATQRALEVWRLLSSVGIPSQQMHISSRPVRSEKNKQYKNSPDNRRVDVHVR